MSKKNKTQAASSNTPSLTSEHAQEYRIIKHDLYRVIGLNVVYLVLVLALYSANNKSHFLERWLETWMS